MKKSKMRRDKCAGKFFVFTDYARPAIRLSALTHLGVIYVMTHDSIGVGEDGPTHQPVEHLDRSPGQFAGIHGEGRKRRVHSDRKRTVVETDRAKVVGRYFDVYRRIAAR